MVFKLFHSYAASYHDIWIFWGCIGLTIFEISPTVGCIRRHFTREFSFAPSYCFSLSTRSQCRFQNVDFLFCGGGGQGGGRPGEKGTGGVQEAGEEGAGSGTPKVAGSGRKRGNYATLRNILQSKKCKGAGAKKYRAGTGIEGYGKLEV